MATQRAGEPLIIAAGVNDWGQMVFLGAICSGSEAGGGCVRTTCHSLCAAKELLDDGGRNGASPIGVPEG